MWVGTRPVSVCARPRHGKASGRPGTGGDVAVVRLFALFHDSRRLHDGTDPEHGPRVAALASELRGILFDLPDESFALLHDACTRHADGLTSDDPTVGTCWDADRLDLGRVGIEPESEFMSTEAGRDIAGSGWSEPS